MDDFPELQAFDNDFAPDAGRRPNLASLADGDYDFEIASAELTRTEKSNEAILRLDLQVAGGGVVQHAYFFRNQVAVNILGSDLCTLGFDADLWKAPQRPFSRELQAACPRLVGVRFRGKKVTTANKSDPSKPYANLYVNQRLDGAASIAPAAYVPQQPVTSDDPIPF